MTRNNTSKKEIDQMIDRVSDQIRKEELDAAIIDSAAERVWARISQSTIKAETKSVENIAVDKIRNCADFQLLIPAYLNEQLTDARKLLFEDHTRECLVCRKALKAARNGETLLPTLSSAAPVAPRRNFNIYRYVAAALLFIALGLIAIPLYYKYGYVQTVRASVQTVDGQVYRVAGNGNYALQSGSELKQDERIRTSKDAHSVVRLGDGSVIEMNERSEFYVTEDNSGITIHLKRGNIIVQAAKQRQRHLYVATDDCRVAVTGTIFSVNNGTKGSRVSVIEGEVKVEQNGETAVLHPGQQKTTAATLEQIPVKDDIAWSRNSEQYLKMLAELKSINEEIAQKVQRPGVRYSTRLLNYAPDGTVFIAALPNLSASLSESYRIMQERIAQNPALKEWWGQNAKENQRAQMDLMIEKVREFGQYIGNEIVVTAQIDPRGKPMAPMILTNINNPSAFRLYLDNQLAQLSSNSNLKIMIVDNPQAVFYGSPKPDLFIWLNDEMMAISTDAVPIAVTGITVMAGSNRFVASPFYKRISEVYRDGAGMIVAADLEQMIASMSAGNNAEEKKSNLLKKFGLGNLKHLIFEQREIGGQSHNRATITFNEKRKGIAAWLAAPGPMGTLDFISPDANLVGAFVIKEPSMMVDEMFGYLDNFDPKFREYLNKMEAEHGISLRKDFAANIGGEFAFAVDGPLLPVPSWKLVFEVNDPNSLQQSFVKLFSEVNRQVVSAGKAGFTFEQEDIDGRTYYTITSIDSKLEINYCFIDGYFVAAPSQALIDRAIKFRETGYNLPRSERFTTALPEDGNANFSAVYYHDLSAVIGPLSQTGLLGNLSKETQQAVKTLSDGKPVLACAYAHGDRIVFAMNSDGPFGLNPNSLMLGLPGSMMIQQVLENTKKK